jgi:predicted nucleotidyltransferase
MNEIEQNIDAIKTLCLKYKVKSLFAFGSVLTDRFKIDSDVDLLVDFMDVDLYDYADNYFNLKTSLENVFHREVDLLEDKAINNPYLRKSIDASKHLIFG